MRVGVIHVNSVERFLKLNIQNDITNLNILGSTDSTVRFVTKDSISKVDMKSILKVTSKKNNSTFGICWV